MLTDTQLAVMQHFADVVLPAQRAVFSAFAVHLHSIRKADDNCLPHIAGAQLRQRCQFDDTFVAMAICHALCDVGQDDVPDWASLDGFAP